MVLAFSSALSLDLSQQWTFGAIPLAQDDYMLSLCGDAMTDETRETPAATVSHAEGVGRLVNLDHAVNSIPERCYWLIGKGRTRPSEPLYAVQLIDAESGIAVAETEGEVLVDTIKAAIEQLTAYQRPEGS